MASEVRAQSQQFIPGMIRHMEAICKDHYEMMHTEKPDLNKGIWYAIDYCQALEKADQTPRLKWAIQTGNSYHGLMPKSFTSIQNASLPSGKKINEFIIAKGFAPSQALEQIQSSLCLLGCGEARDIAVYRTLKELFGQQKFDMLFAGNSPTPLQIGGEGNPYYRLFKRMQLPSATSLEPGDHCHFSNIQEYMVKHPFDTLRGYNAICKETTDPKFLALGLKAKGCSASKVEKALFDGYNIPPVSEKFFKPEISSYIYGKCLLQNEQMSRAYAGSFKDKVLTKEQFDAEPIRNRFTYEKKERRLLLSIERPDLSLIQLLADASLEDSRKIFDRLES